MCVDNFRGKSKVQSIANNWTKQAICHSTKRKRENQNPPAFKKSNNNNVNHQLEGAYLSLSTQRDASLVRGCAPCLGGAEVVRTSDDAVSEVIIVIALPGDFTIA